MDGENNGKPLLNMGWFGGKTLILGNTQMLRMVMLRDFSSQFNDDGELKQISVHRSNPNAGN